MLSSVFRICQTRLTDGKICQAAERGSATMLLTSSGCSSACTTHQRKGEASAERSPDSRLPMAGRIVVLLQKCCVAIPPFLFLFSLVVVYASFRSPKVPSSERQRLEGAVWGHAWRFGVKSILSPPRALATGSQLRTGKLFTSRQRTKSKCSEIDRNYFQQTQFLTSPRQIPHSRLLPGLCTLPCHSTVWPVPFSLSRATKTSSLAWPSVVPLLHTAQQLNSCGIFPQTDTVRGFPPLLFAGN